MPPHTNVHIRPERPGDVAGVRRVNRLAFGGAAEAGLVDALRAAGVATLSLVAVEGRRVVGHILFSPVEIAGDGPRGEVVGLAPMAVLPDRQRQGLGTRLARTALELLRDRGIAAVIVLGHPDYYPRFGFAPASRFGLRWELDCPDEAFMALELRPGALAGGPGVLHFRREFADV